MKELIIIVVHKDKDKSSKKRIHELENTIEELKDSNYLWEKNYRSVKEKCEYLEEKFLTEGKDNNCPWNKGCLVLKAKLEFPGEEVIKD